MTGFAREGYRPALLEELMEDEFEEVFKFEEQAIKWRDEFVLQTRRSNCCGRKAYSHLARARSMSRYRNCRHWEFYEFARDQPAKYAKVCENKAKIRSLAKVAQARVDRKALLFAFFRVFRGKRILCTK
jgi:hypothetical protein